MSQGNNYYDINVSTKYKHIFQYSSDVFELIYLHLGGRLAQSSSKSDESLVNINL